MNISVIREKFLNAILIAERVVGKKESLPILSCFLIQAEKGVSVYSTNLEAGIEVSIPCEVEGKGRVAVPAHILSQTIKSILVEKVSLKVIEGNLIVESKGTKTLIKSISPEEFPTIPSTSTKKGVKLPRELLVDGLRSVSYAASPSMIRPELGSVYILIKDSTVTFVATDSFRLAERVISGGEKGSAEILIPLKHAQEIIHILEHANSDEVSLQTEESQLTVYSNGVRYVSRVIDGSFPNYMEIMPKSFKTEVTLLKGDFIETLKKARVFSGSDQYVGFHVYPKRKIFTVTAQHTDVGEMSDSLDAALSGDDLDINFHIGYLSDCLPIITSDSVTLGFSGPGKPLVIKGVNDPTFTYLVMPLNR